MSKFALVAFSLGLAALSAPSWAQQGSGSAPAATSGQQGSKPANAAARKPARPANTRQQASSLPSDTMRMPQSNDWSIDDALPKGSRAVRDRVPERTPLSRVPLEGGAGTVGFDSFSDSAPRPGQEVYGQRPGSYAGMSISVPSLNKALPTLLPPPPGSRGEW